MLSRIASQWAGSMRRVQFRSVFNVGDKVPVSFMTDVPDPVIKEDSEYPDWVFNLHKPLPTKRELMEAVEKNGMESLSSRELRLLKRRITKETILQNNAMDL